MYVFSTSLGGTLVIQNSLVCGAPPGGKEVAPFLFAKSHVLTFRNSASICEIGRCLPGRSVLRGLAFKSQKRLLALLALSQVVSGQGWEMGCLLMVLVVANGRAQD